MIPGLVLFRWDAPLFFANAELFHDRVLDAVASSPTPVRWVVVAAEPVTSVDVTAADIVAELDDTLLAASIELCFAEMKDPVKDKLKRFGLFTRLGEHTFYATVGEAVERLPGDPSRRCGRPVGFSRIGPSWLAREHEPRSPYGISEAAPGLVNGDRHGCARTRIRTDGRRSYRAGKPVANSELAPH